eukprot:bmy_15688T0
MIESQGNAMWGKECKQYSKIHLCWEVPETAFSPQEFLSCQSQGHCNFPLTGCSGIKPDIISKLEHGEDPWIIKSELSRWIYSDKEKSPDSSQQIISGELSFQREILERAPKDNSLHSVFKVWHINGQIDRYQGNQGRVLRQITVFSHEPMTKKRGPKCNIFRKIFSGCIDLDPLSKTLHHFDSCEKSLKSNLDSLTCNRSNPSHGAPPQIRILKRPTSIGVVSSPNSTSRPALPIKSLVQREAEYAEAWKWILGSASPEEEQEKPILGRPTRISQPEDSRQPNNVIRQLLGPDGLQGFKQHR